MKAMIFAAGLGTRLRPLTDDRPKALVEVGGVPMLERVITHLKDSGFDSIVVNVHHFADKIIDFLSDRDNFGIDIKISDERGELLETGGALVKARRLLDGPEPILVHNADILTDIDLREMMSRHIADGADATLLAGERSTSRYLLFDNGGRLRGWTNTSTGECSPPEIQPDRFTRLAFGGIHVVSQRLLDEMASRHPSGPFSITPFYVDSCGDYDIRAYRPEKEYTWHDIGRLSTLQEAERTIIGQKSLPLQ